MTSRSQIPPAWLDRLQACLSLAQDVTRHAEATEAFVQLRDNLAAEDNQAAALLEILWNEMLSARRSAAFWEQISNVERQMTEQMAAHHTQLQQNYLRLMQEQ